MPHPHQSVLGPLLRVPLFARLKPLQITESRARRSGSSFAPAPLSRRPANLADGAFLIVSGTAEQKAPGALAAPERVEAGSLVGELAMFIEHAAGDHDRRQRARSLPENHARGHARADERRPSSGRHFEDICSLSGLTARPTADVARGRQYAGRRRQAGTARSPQAPPKRPPDKRKAPNPGGGVGRKKRVMRIVPGGKPALRNDVFRLDGGHYR